jgi:hypothetical protein
MARAPYDQFFSSDYDPLTRDLAQYVVDSNSQLPPHLIFDRWGAALPAACLRPVRPGICQLMGV